MTNVAKRPAKLKIGGLVLRLCTHTATAATYSHKKGPLELFLNVRDDSYEAWVELVHSLAPRSWSRVVLTKNHGAKTAQAAIRRALRQTYTLCDGVDCNLSGFYAAVGSKGS